MSTQDKSTLIKLSDIGQTVDRGSDDVRGRQVKDKQGNGVGTVHDLLVDRQDRKVRFLLVEHGGFLGMGETKSFIPVDAITRITDDAVHINESRDHIAQAPRYDPDLIDDRAYHASVYDYYGYMPYWGAGYLYTNRFV